MDRSEAQILKAVMLEASRLGLRVFRNNVGLFKTADDRKVMTGLYKGSADLIGWMPPPNHAFVSIEVKGPKGRVSKEQINWMEQVRANGGFACIINDEKKLKKNLDEYLKLR